MRLIDAVLGLDPAPAPTAGRNATQRRPTGKSVIARVARLPTTVISALRGRATAALGGVALAHILMQSIRVADTDFHGCDGPGRLSDVEPAFRPAQSATQTARAGHRRAAARDRVRS